MTSEVKFTTYLFSYHHNGARWGIEIPATSPEDAKARLSKIALAKFDGELVMTIPVPVTKRFVEWLRELAR